MVKKESRLCARHWKEVQARLARKKREEDQQRQEAYLDEAYQERLAQMSEDEADDSWDPIEDTVEAERDSFVDLIKRLLWLGSPLDSDVATSTASRNMASRNVQTPPPAAGKENADPTKATTKNARKRGKAKAKALDAPKDDAMDDGRVKIEVNESQAEMRKRLVEGVRYAPSLGVKGEMIGGTIESPIATIGRRICSSITAL